MMRNGKGNGKLAVLPLGVRDWQSYAYFQAGVRWRSRGATEEARRMFLRALDHDDENRGALLNLGVLDLEAKDYGRALRRLGRARSIAEGEARFEEGPVWYKATYQIAAVHSYRAIAASSHGDAPDPAKKARQEADRLTATIRDTLREARAAQERPSTGRHELDAAEALERFLESLEPLAGVLRAGIMVEQGELPEADRAVSRILEGGELSYRARYNLACYYSRRAGKEQAPRRKGELYANTLDNLKEAFEGDRALVRWAAEDPALSSLRADAAAKDRFARLREKHAAPVASGSADPAPLGGLAAIGKTYAEQLRERGIASRDDLIVRAATPEAQEKLADELGIDADLVRRWALLADLLRVVRLDARAVNLLEAADVGSLDALRHSEPEKLTRLLSQVNRARSLVEKPPTVETVRRWVHDARKNTLPKVSGGHDLRN